MSTRVVPRLRAASVVSMIVAATSVLIGSLASSALAAGPTIKVSPAAVHAGEIVRVYGVVPGCGAGNEVTLISPAFSHQHDFAGLPAIYASVGAHSEYSVQTRIPAARAAGTYHITGRCGGGNLGVSASLRVIAAPTPCQVPRTNRHHIFNVNLDRDRDRERIDVFNSTSGHHPANRVHGVRPPSGQACSWAAEVHVHQPGRAGQRSAPSVGRRSQSRWALRDRDSRLHHPIRRRAADDPAPDRPPRTDVRRPAEDRRRRRRTAPIRTRAGDGHRLAEGDPHQRRSRAHRTLDMVSPRSAMGLQLTMRLPLTDTPTRHDSFKEADSMATDASGQSVGARGRLLRRRIS